jgi:hypothetical protein
MNLIEIINAWATSFNPTPIQKEKALERVIVCNGCDKLTNKSVFSKTIKVCGACGCPINKKVFSQEYNPCPLKKWEEVDSKYMPEQKDSKHTPAQKDNKTMW